MWSRRLLLSDLYFSLLFKGHTLRSDSDPSPPFLPWGLGACGKGEFHEWYLLISQVWPGTDCCKIQIFMLTFLLLIFF